MSASVVTARFYLSKVYVLMEQGIIEKPTEVVNEVVNIVRSGSSAVGKEQILRK